MSDEFQITPPNIQAAGTDVPPEQIQAGFNSVCRQTQLALNILSTQAETPTGPAGGDLGGTYPNPTVVNLHVTSGTESGVAVIGNTINSSPIGQTTPAAGAFTTLTATTPVGIASGGTGSGTAAGARTNLGLGTITTQNANNVAITGGTIDNAPIGQTTPAAVTATTLNSTGGVLNGSIGATTPSTGSFTTLTASTPIGVPSGGTGLSTITAHSVLAGNGASAISQIGAGTTGQMLLGVTGNFPAFGNNPTITGGTIDGAIIGGTTPAAGHFTTLSTTGAITGIPGRLIGVQRFTASGTYTPTTGTNTAIIEACGGGGGGGGGAATTASQVAVAGPGASGSWGRVEISGPTSQTVTIGAAGSGGAAGANAGGAGGQTSIGTYLVCQGGGGGAAGTAAAFANNQTFGTSGTPGGVPTTSGSALYLANGNAGDAGFNAYNQAGGVISAGASSPYGGGGYVGSASTAANGTGFGAGGNGIFNSASASATAGGNGSAGFVLVYEYS